MEASILQICFASLVLLFIWFWAFHFCNVMILKPQKIRETLRRQGIEGPQPSFFYGNLLEVQRVQREGLKAAKRSDGEMSHNHLHTIYPGVESWSKKYGKTFTYSLGKTVVLNVVDPNLLKEINSYKGLELGKSEQQRKDWKALVGDSIAWTSGSTWQYQRKVIQPTLYPEKVKGMVDPIVKSTLPVLKSWEDRIRNEGGVADIRIDEDLENLFADVISRACFGSTYAQGEKIFLKLRELRRLISSRAFSIGGQGWSYIPTKRNLAISKLEKEIESLIMKMVEDQKKKPTPENHLLESLLDAATICHTEMEARTRFTVDNCKAIYLAGHSPPMVATGWTLLLLATNQDWQDRCRAEVLEACGDRFPDANSIYKLKAICPYISCYPCLQLTMVIHESLRLYPPSSYMFREAVEDMHLGGIFVPKGLTLLVPITMVHLDPDIWGHDVDKFKPERFDNGVMAASKYPHTYLPFGLGSRVCLGQHFAMAEMKVVLALFLSKFSLSVSPQYRHSIQTRQWAMVPEYGINILMKRL
ncbi:hypothetical protein H6P81_014663 [Aristolochia fimbriata]|uniref:Cytochrome P450 n=1 Tax=Aristolochia fimbriata TaxID=158543 RepID=A0AAV7E422_ARIFI|nr:hypothetical protein H6P81_014663 [Aristolochia fimbriata]